MKQYRLDDQNNPVLVPDFEIRRDLDRRRVGYDEIGSKTVSTVFLALDHGWSGDPVLFETAIFSDDEETEIASRYSTWDEAKAGHDAICASLRAGIY